jgi:hypothetical protein
MCWSEEYWEDVKAELGQLAAESEAIGEDETLEQPASGPPVDTPEKGLTSDSAKTHEG